MSKLASWENEIGLEKQTKAQVFHHIIWKLVQRKKFVLEKCKFTSYEWMVMKHLKLRDKNFSFSIFLLFRLWYQKKRNICARVDFCFFRQISDLLTSHFWQFKKSFKKSYCPELKFEMIFHLWSLVCEIMGL